MISLTPNNNKGFILITSYMITALLVIFIIGFASISISEHRIAQKERDSLQAFWLAETGLDKAISELPAVTPLSLPLGNGNYDTQTISFNPSIFAIISQGGVPDTDTVDPNNIIRRIRAIVEQTVTIPDPSDVTSAITADGDVDIQGSAAVDGTVDRNSVFDFEEIFGNPKGTLKDNAAYLYTDPPNNVTPISDLTWVDLSPGEKLTISSNTWQGSGILVVNGDLRITGGTFEGVIWVIGTLWVSGNPLIAGAIFVETGAGSDTTVTGTAEIGYDSDIISGAFGHLPPILSHQILSWKED